MDEYKTKADKLKFNIILLLSASALLVLAATFLLTNLFIKINKTWLLEQTHQSLVNFVVILVEENFEPMDLIGQNFTNNEEKIQRFFEKVTKNNELRFVNLFSLRGETFSSNPHYEFSDPDKQRVIEVLNGKTIIRESVEDGENLIEIYIPLKNKDGVIYGAIEIYHKLSAFNTHLNKTVDTTRTALLMSFSFLTLFIFFWSFVFYKKLREQNDRLVRSEQDLKKNIEMKQLFIAIVNHDLKNPLTVIRFAAANLKEQLANISTLDNTSYLVDLNQIDKTVLKILAMIDEARILSRLEDKQYTEKKTRTNVVKMIQKVIDDFSIRYFKDKTVKIEFINNVSTYHIKALSVLSDVFMNLIDNAIKYSEKEVHIVVEISSQNGSCLITFADNGIGIPDQYKSEIFLRYKRLNKVDVEGTGLGLAIVRSIVELHNGKVWVEDNPASKGSIFRIELPK
jgi:signal transduction histidine kinase